MFTQCTLILNTDTPDFRTHRAYTVKSREINFRDLVCGGFKFREDGVEEVLKGPKFEIFGSRVFHKSDLYVLVI
jgi:hypothetical protein